MQRFARWHIWLGWLVGVPILMWTVTGLFMVARPIDEVRGTTMRVEAVPQPLALPGAGPGFVPGEGPVKEMRAYMQRGRAVSLVTLMDGTVRRYDLATGQPIAEVSAAEARALAGQAIQGGDKVAKVTRFDADEVPFDFRKPMPVWQVALTDGTHVYIGQQTGEIEAVRTRWWRAFDLMWGLHITDLKTREETSHPILMLFAALSAIGALMGCVLMFRRRKVRVAT